MFVELKDKLCIVVGGGMVACRKINALLEFEAKVVVIAPRFCPELLDIESKVAIRYKSYETSDIGEATLVIAATDDVNLNKRISSECNSRRIPVNVVDVKKECSFLFPAYIKKGSITVGVTSSGKSPMISQRIKKNINDIIPDYLEDLVEILGEIREEVKLSFDNEAMRKNVFRQLVELGYSNQGKLTRIEIENIIQKEKDK